MKLRIFILFVMIPLVTCNSTEILRKKKGGSKVSKFFREDFVYCKKIDSFLKLHKEPANWYDAKKLCRLEGSQLMSPETEEMVEEMVRLMTEEAKYFKTSGNRIIHTGYSCFSLPGYYMSIKGERYMSRVGVYNTTHYNWLEYEPSPNTERNNAVGITADGKLLILGLVEQFPFFCYKKYTGSRKNSCGSTLQDYRYNNDNHCYNFHRVAQTYEFALATCIGEGGYLAIVNSVKEAAFLSELFDSKKAEIVAKDYTHTNKYFYIGVRIDTLSGEWLTVFDEYLDVAGYTEWEAKYPQSNDGCGVMDASKKLRDLGCDNKLSFICEMNRGTAGKRHSNY